METMAAQKNAMRRIAAAALPLSKNELKKLPTNSLKFTLRSIPAPNPAEAADNRRYDKNCTYTNIDRQN